MATRPRTERYPWGAETPGPRLRTTSARAREVMAEVDAVGFHRITERVNAAVQGVRPLVDTMDYVGRAGLRGPARNENVVSGDAVAAALGAVNDSLPVLQDASALNLSTAYQQFATAVEALAALAETSIAQGVTGTGAVDVSDPWQAFGA